MRRSVVRDIYWLLSVSASELRDVRNCDMVKRPQHIFIECRVSLLKANFNAIGKQVILSQEIPLLHRVKERLILLLNNDHSGAMRARAEALAPREKLASCRGRAHGLLGDALGMRRRVPIRETYTLRLELFLGNANLSGFLNDSR